MIGVVVAFAGLGLGVWLIVLAVTARPPLVEGLAALDRPGRPVGVPQRALAEGLRRRIVDRASELLAATALDPARKATDLRVSGRSVEGHVADKLTAVLVGAAAGVFLGVVSGGVGLGIAVAAVLSLAGAAMGFLAPDVQLNKRARQRRRGFRHALGGYLDLVNVMMAAGAGPETALKDAAEQGGGWAFAELRDALERSRRTRRSLAETFTQLGAELGVTELAELGAAVSLVGSEGARIRDTLAAKADTLRVQQLAEIEAEAESVTERMTLPVLVLLLAFLLFVGYPAFAEISTIAT